MADDKTKVDETKPDAPPIPTPDPAPEAPKSNKCPVCKNPLDVYSGANDLKVNTGFCSTCGVRYPLKG